MCLNLLSKHQVTITGITTFGLALVLRYLKETDKS